MTSTVPFVGLTGGMGAGKSTALEAFERLGAAVLSSDAVVHELYRGEPLREAVVARWGAVVAPDGAVDRGAIAERAFASEDDRKWLEGLLWPMVGARVAEWLEHARADRGGGGSKSGSVPRAAVVEVPLLFEAGLEAIYDATVAVIAEEGARRERAAGRGHELAEERTARQLSQEEKARRATFVVHNDGSEEELERKLSEILVKLGR